MNESKIRELCQAAAVRVGKNAGVAVQITPKEAAAAGIECGDTACGGCNAGESWCIHDAAASASAASPFDTDEWEHTVNEWMNKTGIELRHTEYRTLVDIGNKFAAQFVAATVKAVPSEALELALCESAHLFLKPDQPYIFRVRPDCPECKALAQAAAPLAGKTGGDD